MHAGDLAQLLDIAVGKQLKQVVFRVLFSQNPVP
jgi:hypothetical protein